MGDIGRIGAAGITSASDFVIAQMTNEQNAKNVRSTNAMNRQIATERNDMEIGMNRENNEFNAAEAQKARDFQVEQWNRENEYNTPEAQMQRYRDAGVNPNVAMSEGLATGSTASTPSTSVASSSGSGVSLASPQMVAPRFDTYQPGQALANIFAAFSQGEQALANSGKTTAEADRIRTLLADELRQMKANATLQEIASDWQPFLNSGQLEKNSAECMALFNQAAKAAADSREADALAALHKAQEITEGWRSKEQKIVAETTRQRIMQEIAESKSRAASNYASAEYSKASAVLARKDTEVKASEILNNEKLREKYVEEIATIVAQNERIDLDNERRKRLSGYIDDLIITGAKQSKQDYWNPFRYVGTLLGGAGAPAMKELLK